jgi:predicted nucleic acid-binding protein
MSDKVFVDTNILMYAHDRSGGEKHNRAVAALQEVWGSKLGVVSTQVLHELCVNLRRKANPPLSSERTRQVLQNYLSWEVFVLKPESVLQAMDIENQYKVSFWDALIIYSAEACGASVLYSEDFSDGQNYGSVRVQNPLLNQS